MSDVSQVRFLDYAGSIAKALDLIGAKDRLPQSGLIIIKPNLTNADKPPVTTAPEVKPVTSRPKLVTSGAKD